MRQAFDFVLAPGQVVPDSRAVVPYNAKLAKQITELAHTPIPPGAYTAKVKSVKMRGDRLFEFQLFDIQSRVEREGDFIGGVDWGSSDGDFTAIGMDNYLPSGGGQDCLPGGPKALP